MLQEERRDPMFWDRVAFIYDIFVNVINRRTHTALRGIVAREIGPGDEVLECACGTGLLSAVIAEKCAYLSATDLSEKMLARAKKNLKGYRNVTFSRADIMKLAFPDAAFDTVVAGNVLHLLDDPLAALRELERVLRPGGKLIIPTYMNRDREGKTSGFAAGVGKAGADFRRQFTVESYRQFFLDAGYPDVRVTLAEGRIPCAVAVLRRRTEA